jgi:hypothetical protein
MGSPGIGARYLHFQMRGLQLATVGFYGRSRAHKCAIFFQGLRSLGAAKPWANIIPQPLNFSGATFQWLPFSSTTVNTIRLQQKFHALESPFVQLDGSRGDRVSRSGFCLQLFHSLVTAFYRDYFPQCSKLNFVVRFRTELIMSVRNLR